MDLEKRKKLAAALNKMADSAELKLLKKEEPKEKTQQTAKKVWAGAPGAYHYGTEDEPAEEDEETKTSDVFGEAQEAVEKVKEIKEKAENIINKSKTGSADKKYSTLEIASELKKLADMLESAYKDDLVNGRFLSR